MSDEGQSPQQPDRLPQPERPYVPAPPPDFVPSAQPAPFEAPPAPAPGYTAPGAQGAPPGWPYPPPSNTWDPYRPPPKRRSVDGGSVALGAVTGVIGILVVTWLWAAATQSSVFGGSLGGILGVAHLVLFTGIGLSIVSRPRVRGWGIGLMISYALVVIGGPVLGILLCFGLVAAQ